MALNINNLPEINKNSDADSWLTCVKHLIPADIEDFTLKLLRKYHGVTQMLVISKIDVPDESHEDVLESLLILKGSCRCTIGGKAVVLKEGDYIDIPLHVQHNVKVLTPYVVAILQHKAVA